MYELLQTRFEVIFGCIEHLQLATKWNRVFGYTKCKSLYGTHLAFSVSCVCPSLRQQCPMIPCTRSSPLTTVPFLYSSFTSTVDSRYWNETTSRLKAMFTTDCKSARLSQCQSLIWGPWPDFYHRKFRVCWHRVPSLTRGRICSFTIAAGPRHCSLSLVPVPRY
jgi:hypothetical protein